MLAEFTQELKNLTQDTLRGIHTALPGKVDSFDATQCRASVVPYGKFRKPDGSYIDFPKLANVPVYIMQGSGQTATIAYPIKSGDECLLLFSEQTLDVWETGASSNTDLRFDLSNAIAIVGLFAKPNPLVKTACDNDALIIEKDGQSIMLSSSAVTMKVNSLVVQSSGNVSFSVGGSMTLNGANIETV